jgi:2,5-diamino-6-(ribosylamino)-4(3H)-pyrimidinone 5'-phosphate reductase
MKRTYNTLFLIISLDGKISTGGVDDRDIDKDYKAIKGIKEGLYQYYEIEKHTDWYSLNTGRVMAKIGVNTDHSPIKCPGVNFIIVDNKHLTKKGIINLTSNLRKLFLVTKNPKHPAFKLKIDNLVIIKYKDEIDFRNLFEKLKTDYKAEKVTIQSGGTLNSILIRSGLIDKLSIVIAPALVGGKDTSTLVDGYSLVSKADLKLIRALKLIEAKVLENSYLHLTYEVVNN